MRPVGVKAEDETFTWQDALVAVRHPRSHRHSVTPLRCFSVLRSLSLIVRAQDPLSNKTILLWNQTAEKNTEAFDNVFHVVPCKHVEGRSASSSLRAKLLMIFSQIGSSTRNTSLVTPSSLVTSIRILSKSPTSKSNSLEFVDFSSTFL